MEPRGAVGVLRRPLHAARLQPEHPRQPRRRRPRAGRGTVAMCVSSRPMSAAASAPRTSPMPNTRLILWAARRTGRPVKWIATRSETFLSDHQARDHVADGDAGAGRRRPVSGAARRQHRQPRRLHGGRFGRGADQPVSRICKARVYDIPAIALHVRAVLTNTTPIGVTRGPGFGEAVNIIERLIDAAARAMRFRPHRPPPAQFRPATTPMTNALGLRRRQRRFPRAISTWRWPTPTWRLPARRRDSEAQRQAPRHRPRLPHQGHRRLPTENVDIRFEPDGTRLADHRHPDHRPGARDDHAADPRRPAGPAERR